MTPEEEAYVKQLEEIVRAFVHTGIYSFNGVLDDILTDEYIAAWKSAMPIMKKIGWH